MPFPTVVTSNTSLEGGNTTSHTVSLPAGISAGDLLLIFIATDGANTITNWNGFTQLFNESNSTSLSVGWKKATGSEGATVVITSDNSEMSAHVSHRIVGHIDPDIQAPEVSTGATGSDQYPDPDSLTPAGGAKDYFWIAVEGNDHIDEVTVYPLPDNNVNVNVSGPFGCSVGVCSDELNQVSLDPGTFTIAGPEHWVACTIAVHPAPSTGLKINIGDDLKDVAALQINIGDAWKEVAGMQINIGDAWKTIF